MEVSVRNDQDDLPLDTALIPPLVELVFQEEKVLAGEVSVSFVSLKEIKKLHKEYFDDPTETDTISLCIDPPGPQCELLGEAVVCPRVAMVYVAQSGGEIYHEVTRYLVHSLLHLIGYQDQQISDQRIMQEREDRLLEILTTGRLLVRPKIG